MLRSSSYDYSDACILVKGTITIPNTATENVVPNNRNKKVIFNNCVPLTNCISDIIVYRNTWLGNFHDMH